MDVAGVPERVGEMGVELVVTDLDGTLWGADERVHERTAAAFGVLAARGVPVLAATGRRLRSAATTLARCGLVLPVVALDGGLGRDLPGGQVFHRAGFRPEQAAGVLAAFGAEGLSPCAYVDRADAEVLVGPRPSTSPAHLAGVGPWLRRAHLAAAVERDGVMMFAVVGVPPAQTPRLQRVAAAVGGLAHAVVTRDVLYGGVTLVVRPDGVSKWNGVLAWCAARDVDPGRVLAVGDGENDVELLGSARVACVVADGCAAALSLATHVIAPAAAGGWAAVVDLV